MPTYDFTTNPFTVVSLSPAGSTITVGTDPTNPQLEFAPPSNDYAAGFGCILRLPLSLADIGAVSTDAVQNWFGTVTHTGGISALFQLLDNEDENSYGQSFLPALGLPPPVITSNFGSTGHGFSSAILPATDEIGTVFYLEISMGVPPGFYFPAPGPAIVFRDLNLSVTVYPDPNPGDSDDSSPPPPVGSLNLFEPLPLSADRGPIPLTLDLTETLPLIVVDPTTISNKPPGTGQPKRFSDGAFLDSCDPSDARATVCTRTTRAIPAGLATHLAGECLTLAYCLRVVRRDGVTLGFTTHDADLTFDPGLGPVAFEALNSLSVTALRQELGATVGNMDLAGLIRSDRITAADLFAGRYDGAELTLYLVNWENLDDGFLILARGWFGSVTTVDGKWTAEYRSVAQRLQQQIVEQTSPTCRVLQLGDARCKISLTPFQFSRVVNSVVDGRNFTFGADTHAANYYAAGRVIFVTGANEALQREVKRSTPAAGSVVIELQEGFPFEVAIGDLATLEAGCDRRFATCRDKFANQINFRGEPNVPGASALKRIQSLVVVG